MQVDGVLFFVCLYIHMQKFKHPPLKLDVLLIFLAEKQELCMKMCQNGFFIEALQLFLLRKQQNMPPDQHSCNVCLCFFTTLLFTIAMWLCSMMSLLLLLWY